MATTDTVSATITFTDGSDEVVPCSDIGISSKYLMLFDDDGRPFRFINNELVDDISVEYSGDFVPSFDFGDDVSGDIH